MRPNQLVYSFWPISNLKLLDEEMLIFYDLCFFKKQLHLFWCIGFLFLFGFSFYVQARFDFLFMNFVI